MCSQSESRHRLDVGRLLMRCLCLWLAGWLWVPAALAQDHITARAWLEDPTLQMTWQEAQQAPVQTYTGTLSKGFGPSAIWLRLRIDPNSSDSSQRSADRLVLRIRPVYLDDIQVFDPLSPTGLAGRTGDIHHPRKDELRSLSFLVTIARGEQPRDIWLRLVSTSTRQIDVQALTMDELNQTALTHSLVFAGYLGIIAVIAVWGIVHWVFSRDAIVGVFGLAQLAALVYAMASLGHLRSLWPVHWPAWVVDQTATVFSITAVSAAIWLHVLLLREFTPLPSIRKIHLAQLFLLPIKLIILALGWPRLALELNMFEVLLAPVIFLLSALLATGWNKPPEQRPALARFVVIGFYTLLLVMLMGASLPALGIIKGTEIALYIVQLHGMVVAFLVLLLLQYRAHAIQLRQRSIALELERSQLQTQQERGIREEQEKLLAMLAHELKTPLATMSMRLDPHAVGAQQIKQAIRDMNGVIERCQQTLQFSDKQLSPQNEATDMVGIVRDAVLSCPQPERVVMDLPAHLRLNTDRQLWFIVLNNLLENACKYAAPDTPIALRLHATQDARGMPQMQLDIANQPGHAGWPDPEKLFDKYYRSPHGRRQAGTGLGLYLVRNLMHVMGGRIDYAPTADRVRLVLQLPMDAAPQSVA